MKKQKRIRLLAVLPAAVLLIFGIYWLWPKQETVGKPALSEEMIAVETAPTETPAHTIHPTEAPKETQPPETEAAEAVENPTDVPLPEETEPTETMTEPQPTEETEPAPPQISEADETVYAAADVNIRKGPGTDYEKAGMLHTGESAHRTGTTDTDWSRIEWEGETCFVSSYYVSTQAPAPAADSFPLSYADGTLDLTITKEWFGQSWCYAAHVLLSDFSRLSTFCANGSYDNGYETTSSAAERIGAVLAVNGDYSASYLDYIVVRDGVIRNGADRNMWMPGVYSAHTGLLQSAWETGGVPGVAGASVQQLVDDGMVTDTFCFGPPVLQNGAVFVGSGGGRAQRTFIGTNGSPGDLWIVVADGRYNDGESLGLTAEECALFLQSKGCTLGVPLDGGGSSTMVFNGRVLNATRYEQRAVVDFLALRR